MEDLEEPEAGTQRASLADLEDPGSGSVATIGPSATAGAKRSLSSATSAAVGACRSRTTRRFPTQRIEW